MTRSKNIVVANLKMYLSLAGESERWIENFLKFKKNFDFNNTELVICPPFVFLESFLSKVKSENIFIGAQNCFWENKGAFTGEISPMMLSSMGVKHVILGHSERRNYLGEDNKIISHKISIALKNGLKPIVCIGENIQEKTKGLTMRVVLRQLEECLLEVSRSRIEDVILCYEPVWAISANNPIAPPTSDEIMSARLLLKKFLVKKYGEKIAEKVRIIYGGSINGKNVNEVCVDSGMKGGLVGSAGSIPYEILKIVKSVDEN